MGYRIRATGFSPKASTYAGYQPETIIIITMAISGALAGMMAVNEILGVQHRVILNFTSGYGFTGIAVALMGRNHPLEIIFASLLVLAFVFKASFGERLNVSAADWFGLKVRGEDLIKIAVFAIAGSTWSIYNKVMKK